MNHRPVAPAARVQRAIHLFLIVVMLVSAVPIPALARPGGPTAGPVPPPALSPVNPPPAGEPAGSRAPAPPPLEAGLIRASGSPTTTLYLPLIFGGSSREPDDPLAPQIELRSPWGYVPDSRPTITAAITDVSGTGIDSRAITASLNGTPLPVRYDPARGEISAGPTGALPAGSHTLSITVTDRAGHLRTESRQFEVIDPGVAAVVTLSPALSSTLRSPDGRLTLVVPSGAVTQPVKIKAAGYPQLSPAELAAGQTPPAGIPFYLFTLDAWRQGDRAAAGHFQFQQPVTLTATYLVTETRNRVVNELTLVVRNEISSTWEVLTGTVDLASQTVTARTDHFSTYGLTGPDDGILSPSLDAFQVGLFGGGALYSTDLSLPAGAGGLTPGLTLAYDGTAPNSMYGPHGADGGWVGAGWSLNLGSINAERIVLNGISAALVQEGESNRYHTESETFLKIEAQLDETGQGHWQATAPDGTQYFFGTGEALGASLYFWQDGPTCDRQARDYKLYRVVDPNGNTVEIDYELVSTGWLTCSGQPGVKAAYPRQIRYGLNPAAGDTHAEYRVQFLTSPKLPDLFATAYVAETGRLLERVEVEYVSTPGGEPQLIRAYDLSYVRQHGGWLLSGLESLGSDGSSSLPGLTFDYAARPVGYRYRGDGLALVETWERPFLSRISSDYGARVTYSYRPESYSGFELRQLVGGRTVEELVTGLQAAYRYDYAEPALAESAGQADPNRLIGFGRAAVTGPTGDVSRHWFHTDPATQGRERRSQQEDGQGHVYSRVDRQYGVTTAGLPPGVQFVHLAEETHYTCDGAATGDDTSACRQTRAAYSYDGYGNVTRQEFYGEGSLLHYSSASYRPNLERWLLNRPAEALLVGADGKLLRQTQYFYDGAGSLDTPPAQGNLTRSRAWIEGGEWAVTEASYDGRGNPLVVTGPTGQTVTTGYDSLHGLLPTSVRNNVGHTSYATYDFRFQRPLNQTDPNGATTTFEYDRFGRLVKLVRPGDSSADPTASYRYVDPAGPGDGPAYRQSDLGGGSGSGLMQLVEFFDGLGRPLQQRELTGEGGQQAVTDITYDSRGWPVKQSIPYLAPYATGWVGQLEGQPGVQYAYDPLGRVTAVTAPDGSRTTSAYDRWQVTLTDPNGHRRRSETDALGRLVKVEEFDGNGVYATTRYNYNGAGDLLTVTDAAGNVTRMDYDHLGRKVEMVDPDMGRWQYAYDPAGNLTRQTDARGQAIAFAYDDLGRMASKDYGADSGFDVSFSYDAGPHGLGRRTGMVDEAGSVTWVYDSRGRVTDVERQLAGRSYSLAYQYDKLDRQTVVIYPDGEQVSTTYNQRGLANSLTSSLGETFVNGSVFNALGQLTGQQYGNGLYAGYGYYSAAAGNNRLERLQVEAPDDELLLDLNYVYDAVGNVTQMVDHTNDVAWAYRYDFLDRLTGADRGAEDGTSSYSYAYDPLGNLTARTDPLAGLSLTLSYPAAGQPHPHAPTQVSDGGTLVAGFDYDQNGNRAVRQSDGGQVAYSFDVENRLAAVISETAQGGAVTTTFVYDGDGQRLKRVTGDGGETVYVGDYVELSTGWGPNEPVFNSTGSIPYYPNMASDAAGRLYLAWVENPTDDITQLWFATRDPESREWSQPELVTSATTTYYGGYHQYGGPSVAVDPAGETVYIAWVDYGEYPPWSAWGEIGWTDWPHLAHRTTDGHWNVSALGEEPGPDLNISVTTNPGGKSYVAWESYDHSNNRTILHGPNNDYAIEYRNSTHPAIAADSQENVYLTFVRGGELYLINDYTLLEARGYFDIDEVSDIELVGDINTGSGPAVLAIDSQDKLWVAWRGSDNRLYLRQRLPDHFEEVDDEGGEGDGEWVRVKGEWGPAQVNFDAPITEFDLVVDANDVPQWIVVSEGRFYSSSGQVSREQMSYGDQPTMAVGGDGVLAAVWTDGQSWSDQRLYVADNLRITKHYYVDGRRVATRVDGELYYIHGDHLGSTSLITAQDGQEVGRVFYSPYGSIISRTGTLPTDRLFTGQRWESGLDLYDYRARFYDPLLGRFVSPDTIVPEPGNPQALNRYAYVYNNPVRYTDPTGHCIDGVSTWVCVAAAAVLALDAIDVGSSLYITSNPDQFSAEDVDYAQTSLGLWQAGMMADGPMLAGDAIAGVQGAWRGGKSLFRWSARAFRHADDTVDAVRAASKLIEVGIHSDEAPNLIRILAEASTGNGRVQGGYTILGNNPEYLYLAKLEGQTYLNLPDEVLEVLDRAGAEFIWSVNKQFLDDSIAAGHSFVVTVGEGKQIGKFLKREIDYLTEHGYKWVDGVLVKP